MKLDGKVAIITGSTSGIGLDIAKCYLKNGANVVICGTNPKKLINVTNELKEEFNLDNFLVIKADVTSTEDVKNLFRETINKFKHLDILVNNAGVAPRSSMEETSDEEFLKVLNINLMGAFKCTREAISYMKDTGGSIINTSSFVSLYGSPYQAAYSSSKAAINGLTKSNAKELGKYNIRVNAVAPGVVMTEMVKNDCDEETINRLNLMTPLKRGATPDDLVGIYLYLASDDAKFTTGTIINIDGGLVM